jgi:hypothetical protein
MTGAQQTPSQEKAQLQPAVRRNGRWSGFRHILDVRLRELWREPEVIFWVFGFPILLALGLGIAFRDKPADNIPVAIISGPESQNALSMNRRRCVDFGWGNTIW